MAPINKLPKKIKSSKCLDDSIKGDELSSSGSYSCLDSNMGSDSKQFARINRVVLDKNSDEYKKRRESNNLAVENSMNNSKFRTQQKLERLKQLKQEYEMLETKIKIFTKELNFLKDYFLTHTGTAHNGQIQEIDMSFLQNNYLDGSHEVPEGNGHQMCNNYADDDDSEPNN